MIMRPSAVSSPATDRSTCRWRASSGRELYFSPSVTGYAVAGTSKAASARATKRLRIREPPA